MKKKKKVKITKVYGYPLLNKVIKKLFAKLPQEYRDINFSISITLDKSIKSACAIAGDISFGAKCLKKFRNNEYVLVGIVAHELGHHVLGHLHDKSGNACPANEWDCDLFGLFLAMCAGYNPLKYLEAERDFYLWFSKSGKLSTKKTKTHGSDVQRLNNVMAQLEYLGFGKVGDKKNPQ